MPGIQWFFPKREVTVNQLRLLVVLLVSLMLAAASMLACGSEARPAVGEAGLCDNQVDDDVDGDTDCDDSDCSGDPACESVCPDVDGDGFTDQDCGGNDCDDADPSVYPGAVEVCGDTVDQDCDGQDLACTCADADSDGFKDQACGGNDCDDGDPAVHPSAAEDCADSVDNDCDGDTDAVDQACNVEPVGDPQGNSLNPWNGFLALGPDKVYFGYAGRDAGGAIVGGVAMAAKDGTGAWCIACDTGEPRELATDAASVYWADPGNGELRKAPLDGSRVDTLWTGQIGSPVAVDSKHVYFFDAGANTVMQVEKDGSSPAAVETNQIEVNSIAAHSKFLYWLTQSELKEKDLAGGTLNTLASGLSSARSVAVDATHVYWAQGQWNGSETIQSMPRGGGAATQLSAAGAYAIALDASYVYAADNHDGEILRVPKAGGIVEILASSQPYPFDIAVDGLAVYWSSETDAKVARVLK